MGFCTRSAFSLLALGLCLAPPRELLPQSSLSPGMRVRVTAPSRGLTSFRGTVRSFYRDSLTVDTVIIPLASMTSLEVGHYRATGALVGAVVGFAAAQVVGRAVGLDPSSSDDWFFYPLIAVPSTVAGAAVGASPKHATIYGAVGALAGGVLGAGLCFAVCEEDPDLGRSINAALGAALGGPLGLTLGAVVGALTHLTQWRPIPIDQLRVAITPSRDGGVVLGATVFP